MWLVASILYAHKNSSLVNFSKSSLKSFQRLRRYKCAKLAFQNIKQALTIKTFSTIVLHMIILAIVNDNSMA